MAEIIPNEATGGKPSAKKRAKRHSTHIDMTPMVDLMSLLITFFMLTTAFCKPKIMEILLPDQGVENQGQAPSWRTLNILLSEQDRIYYYIGKPPKEENDLALLKTQIQKSDFGNNGIRKVILKMNMKLFEKIDSAEQAVITGANTISKDSLNRLLRSYKKMDHDGPIVMIKADDRTKYKNIVDIIDEMAICNVARYSVVDINDYENQLLETIQN
jgi:biopolymer transport protein ExbD